MNSVLPSLGSDCILKQYAQSGHWDLQDTLSMDRILNAVTVEN